MKHAALLALLVAVLAPETRAGAQVASTLELSSGLARRAPARVEPGIGLSPSFALRHGALDSRAGGTLTRFMRGGLAADVEGYASLAAPEWRCLRVSSTLAGELHEYPDAGDARRAELQARVGCRLSPAVEGWAVASAASARAQAAERRGSIGLELGARLGEAVRGVSISVRSVSLPGFPALYRDTAVWISRGTRQVRQTQRVRVRDAVPAERHVDLAARGTWMHGYLGAELDLGARVGGYDRRAERWASAALSYRVLPGVTLAAEYGATPSERDVGLDRSRRLALALRVTREERPTAAPGPDAPVSTSRAHLQLLPIAPGLQALRLRAPDARSVEIAGDFSEWSPLPLERVGDEWEARLPLEPGVYRINLRLDGGPWVAPPGLPAERDGFGGEVGVLVVPEPAPH